MSEEKKREAVMGGAGCYSSLDIRNVDCMDLMREFPDKYFDLALTSPPYNMNLRVNSKGDGYCSRQVVKELSTKYESFSDNLPMREYESFLDGVIRELLRVARLSFFNIQMITGNKPALFRIIGKYSEQIKEVIIWDKLHSQPAIGRGVLNSRFEFVLVLGSNPITRAFPSANFERGTLDNVWEISKRSSTVKGHGATFPLSLAEKVIGNFCPNGGKVLDPFLGTGTTALAAYKLGRECVGSELSEAYFQSACERIERETAQMTFL